MGMDAVLRKVLKNITPTPKEVKETQAVIGEFQDAVRKEIKPLTHTLAGSFVRNTWMKDKKEFDIFIMFPEYTKRATLEKKGLDLGKKIVKSLAAKSTVAYAEHPYTRATYRGYDVDIVPCYKISDPTKIKSAVDRTPFHNQYLSRHFPPQLSGEVRLLKRFLKASGLYGSNTKTLGFSGYLCELLILHYKSFKSLVREASKWEPGLPVIDLESHLQSRKEFLSHPIIVIDPVDPKRNVAAVLPPENFLRFTSQCRGFLKSPGLGFFFPRQSPTSPAKLKKKFLARATTLLGVEFSRPDVIDDVLYPQLRRTVARLASMLKDSEFLVLGTGVHSSQKHCILFFEVEAWELPSVRKLVGPPVFVHKHAKNFLKKYQKDRLWVEGAAWVAEVKRKHTKAENLLKAALQGTPLHLQQRGIASHIATAVRKKHSILTTTQLLKPSRKDFHPFLENYLERKIQL